jgi:CBS domain-containing protein
MRRIPRIKTVMTPFPYSIASTASLEDARAMMSEHDIRHLPVCEGHRVIGILSERDTEVANRAADRALGSADATTGARVSVGEVCLGDPLLVDLELRLDSVAAEMASRRVGSAIVMRGDKLAGILTTTDVCRLLAATLRDADADGDGDDVA